MDLSHIDYGAIWTGVTSVVASAAVIAAAAPQGEPGTWWYAIRRGVIDIAALNIGNAKNAVK